MEAAVRQGSFASSKNNVPVQMILMPAGIWFTEAMFDRGKFPGGEVPHLGQWYCSCQSTCRKNQPLQKKKKAKTKTTINLHSGCHPPSDASHHSKKFTCVTQPPSWLKQL